MAIRKMNHVLSARCSYLIPRLVTTSGMTGTVEKWLTTSVLRSAQIVRSEHIFALPINLNHLEIVIKLKYMPSGIGFLWIGGLVD